MAKRRVGNPLFNTKEPEQFMNLQEPGFLDEIGGDEMQVLEDLSGLAQDEPMPEAAPPMPVQDARQIPLNPADDPNLKKSGFGNPNEPLDESITRGLMGFGGNMIAGMFGDKPSDMGKAVNSGLTGIFGSALSGDMKDVTDEDVTRGLLGGVGGTLTGAFGDPFSSETTIPPGEDMYTQGMKQYAQQMGMPSGEERDKMGEGFIKGISGNVGKEGDDAGTAFVRGMTGMQGDIPPYKNDSPEGDAFVKAMSGQVVDKDLAKAFGVPEKEEDLPQDTLQQLGGFASPEEGQQQEAPAAPEDPQFAEKLTTGQPPIKQQVTEEEVEQRAQTDAKAVPGAIQAAKENPYVMAELNRLNGIGEMPPELMQYAEEWEEVFTRNKGELSQRAKSLEQKLESGQLSDFDKLGIALAVAVPVIMGLMYGGTAFALATSGVLQSMGQMKIGEEKQRMKAKSDLDSVNKERLKLSEEGIKTKQGLIDKIPNKDAKRFVRDKEILPFGDDLGISAGDEQRALWIDSKKIHDDEDVKKIRERTKEAEELIGGVNNFNEALNGVQDIISAIQDQDPGLLNMLAKNYKVLETASPDQIANSSLGDILSLLSKIPGIKQKGVEIEVLGADGKTTKINGLDALQQSVKALQNDYNTAVLKGSRLTENVMKHWSGIMFDPTSISQFLSSGVEGWSENAKNLRNIMNRKIQEELVGYGFIRQPLQETFPVEERTILRPVSAVNRDINKNPDAYKGKVR